MLAWTSTGVVGSSKGAEAALIVASRDSAIKAVVAGMPSSVAWPGISYTPKPQASWTSRGKPVAYLPYVVDGPFNIYNAYDDGLKALAQHPDAVIKVEDINGPILLVCGKADTLWPSCPMSRQIVARLKANGFAHSVQVLAYDNAGHAVFGPPVPTSHPAYAGLGSLGGTPAGNDAAREDDWPKTIAFLHTALGS